MPDRPRIRRALTIAGSDSGGGAGIQADLKAFAACGVHGMSAITAITVQNTVGVDAIQAVEPGIILGQVRAVARDIGVDAVKVGMLGDVATIDAVAEALGELRAGAGARPDPHGAHGPHGDPRDPHETTDAGPPLGHPPVVLDPVMVSESGATLLSADARGALAQRLLAHVDVITPNLPEARALAGLQTDDVEQLTAALRSLGAPIVVITGGHRDEATDVFFDGRRLVEIPGERHPDGAAHGSGCTHSSVLAARLALGDDPLTAARTAKRRAAAAVRDGLVELGDGPGPVDVLAIRG